MPASKTKKGDGSKASVWYRSTVYGRLALHNIYNILRKKQFETLETFKVVLTEIFAVLANVLTSRGHFKTQECATKFEKDIGYYTYLDPWNISRKNLFVEII